MKIQSHSISMQSQHTLSQNILEAQVSFSTFFTPQTETQTIEEIPEAEPNLAQNDYTLNSIIQNLIEMISAKINKNTQAIREPNSKTHISIYEKFQENESLDVATTGMIKTDSGCFDINLNFSMSRSFVIENHIDIYSSFDPLIINLDGEIPSLCQDTFSFDLDNDGECDQISKLTQGNGYLALDKNDDGEINQGSELFGTITGNGFGELAEYDEDHNDWIDENDSIFNKLRVWLNNETTKDSELVSLGEVGIGAIYLNATASEFTYKTEMNQTLGELKSSSFFLNENGTCGNISQIDLAKTQQPLAQLLQV